MEGNLQTIPLTDLLGMLYEQKSTGLLRLEAGQLPLSIYVQEGEVIHGAIMDWEGLEAISTFPPYPSEGRFRFFPEQTTSRTLFMNQRAFLGEWARLYDEWGRCRSLIDSPSRVVETPRPVEPYGVFFGGKSVRGAAKVWGVPLIIAAQRTWRGLREGDLQAVKKYSWYGLRIRHPSARRTQAGIIDPKDLTAVLDGNRNLGELIQFGYRTSDVRRYLIKSILAREIQIPGQGWLLRDLLWEEEAKKAKSAELVSQD